jgi:hypothetical protein
MSKEHELDGFGRENQDFLYMGLLEPTESRF